MEILPVRFNQLMASMTLTVQQVCALILQAAQGLHEAWVKRRLLHLDVKPGNLMITSDGVVRVTDFGIAKEMDRSTGTGHRHGTLWYMAPERLHGEHIGQYTDIYSLGLVMLELLTGQPAYDRGSPTVESFEANVTSCPSCRTQRTFRPKSSHSSRT
jgi:serine/threonine-protein kinase